MSSIALMMMLAVQVSGEAAAAPPSNATAPAEDCRTELPTEPGEVVVCAVRPNGYRIDPDVLAAERMKKDPKGLKPPERHVDKSCDTVGPMGCRGAPTVDLIGAGLAAVKMADKLAKGASVGSLLKTTPTPSEYELYLEAKRRREAQEEAAFVEQAVKASKAEVDEAAAGTSAK